jgi:hypothetical protein
VAIRWSSMAVAAVLATMSPVDVFERRLSHQMAKRAAHGRVLTWFGVLGVLALVMI